MQNLGEAWSWRQDDPASATVEEVIAEFQKATDTAVFSGCIMIGMIIELVTDDPPAWLLRCDGTEYANVDYPDLAAVIHANFHTDDDHFRVPDRDRRLGMDGMLMADTEGEETHTLTVAEIPSHRHTQDQFGSALSSVLGALEGFAISPEAGYTGYEGGGEAHNNIQPVEGTAFYIVARFPYA